MNILIVDDDTFVVDALKSGLDWASLNIENVFTSYNVKNAKKILETVQIHILLCDIEMPKENGLALLKWIREKELVLQNIFLTSYDEFEYASEAIELQTFSYVLKPVSYEKLEAVLQKAVNKEKEVLRLNDYRMGYEFWIDSEKNRRDMFWQKLLVDKELLLITDTLKYVKEMGLSYQEEDTFTFITVELINPEASEKLDKGMMEWTILSSTEAVFQKEQMQVEDMIRYGKSLWVIIFRQKDGRKLDKLKEASENLIHKLSRSLQSDICCGIGETGSLNIMNRNLSNIIKMCEDNVLRENQVLSFSEYEFAKHEYTPPNFNLWRQLLIDLKNDDMIKAVNDYLTTLTSRRRVNREVLSMFVMDFTQMVFTALHEENIMLHGWKYEYFNVELSAEAIRTVNSLKSYLKNVINDVIKVFQFNAESKSVVDIVKEYIDHNIEQDISRESLAHQVYLNPDYLARLFKKEVGDSLGNYIRDKRIKIAMEYFDTTDDPINVVALRVGYDNFSYFSKVFKDVTGITPKDYKNKADENRVSGR